MSRKRRNKEMEEGRKERRGKEEEKEQRDGKYGRSQPTRPGVVTGLIFSATKKCPLFDLTAYSSQQNKQRA